MDFITTLKEVFNTPEDKKLKNVASPTDQSGFMDILKSVFSVDTAKTLTEEVIPGTSDVVSAKRAIDSLGEAGRAIRQGDAMGALKGYADAATNAMGALPMVPAFGGILTGARGAAKGVSEIPDRTSFFDRDKFKSIFKNQNKEVPITEIYKNEALYELYPELKNIKVSGNLDLSAAGLYSPDTKNITLKGHAPEETLIHELQHAVDDIETKGGFAKDYVNPLSEGKLENNLDQYFNHPAEVRAREAADKLIRDRVKPSNQ